MLGLTHRPTDEICSSRVDTGEILQFRDDPQNIDRTSPRSTTDAFLKQIGSDPPTHG